MDYYTLILNVILSCKLIGTVEIFLQRGYFSCRILTIKNYCRYMLLDKHILYDTQYVQNVQSNVS